MKTKKMKNCLLVFSIVFLSCCCRHLNAQESVTPYAGPVPSDADASFLEPQNAVKVFREQWCKKIKEIVCNSVETNKKNAELSDGEKYTRAFVYYIGDTQSVICSPGYDSIREFKLDVCVSILQSYLKYRASELLNMVFDKKLTENEINLIKLEHKEILETFHYGDFNSIVVNGVDMSSLNIPVCIMCMNTNNTGLDRN